jgi:Tol biopolymer transport system component
MEDNMIKRIGFNLLIIVALFAGLSGFQPAEAPALAAIEATATMPPPYLEFAGIERYIYDPGENDVPNTTGAAGHTHFLQAVNEFIALFRKDGTQVFFNTFEGFWTGALPTDPLNPCNGGPGFHHSMPYVMYDHLARRWVVADVAYADMDNGPYEICVAVSKPVPVPASLGPGDPTYFTPTYWYYYAIPTSASQPHFKPENIKLGLWPDGYYMAADLVDIWNSGLNRTPKGAKVWALNRNDLINGNMSTFRFIPFYLNEALGYEHLVPTNLLGYDVLAPDTPNYFASIQPGRLHLWKFKADWVQQSNSTFGVNLKPDATYATDTAATWAFGYIVPQPYTNEKLDVLGERLMSPMQYRIINGEPALWLNHTIMRTVNGAPVSALRWYELRELGSNPFKPIIFQQGTYFPDAYYRWLSSLAVDKRGNMAIGFSVSGDTPANFLEPPLFPSIYYAGRLVDDPLGDLTQGENTLYSGSLFQDNDDGYENGLWGLQSQMSVDPLDECSFWYTNVYYDGPIPWPIPDQSLYWRTRIGRFGFQQCRGGGNVRVSLHTDDTQGNLSSGVFDTNVDLENSTAISATGRYVAFSSEATNLVDNDTNGKRDVFLRDRDTDNDAVYDEPGNVKTIRISVGPNGLQSNGHSSYVSIDYSGRFIVYSSEANNLLVNHLTYDFNGTWDVFLYDRDTDADGIFDEPGFTRTTLVSAKDGTTTSGDSMSDQPFISGDGKYVVFRSYASNLGGADAMDTNSTSDIYMRSLVSNDTWLVSGASAGPNGICAPGLPGYTPCIAGNGPSYTPSISTDMVALSGPRITFTSEATNLNPIVADANGFADVYWRQFVRSIPYFDSNILASVDDIGTQGFCVTSPPLPPAVCNGDSYTPYISGNGRFIAFASRATNFVLLPLLPDTNNVADIFVRDLSLNTTRRISVNFSGMEATGGDSYLPSITFDGQFIAFSSDAVNLDTEVKDVNAQRDVFLHDRALVLDGSYDFGLTQRISLSVMRGEANDRSLAPMIAANGRHVAYPSEATNLVVNDTNSVWDVFAFDSQKQLPVFLQVDRQQKGGPGEFVSVPIYFNGNGIPIDATTFSIDFDELCLNFLNRAGDVVFDPAIAAAGLISAYTYDAADTDSEIDLYVYDGIPPRTPIPTGTLVTITFQVRSTCLAAPGTENTARVGFSKSPSPSFASTGQSVLGMTKDGFVRIGEGTPGDCNGDGLVDAGDLSGLINELFDPDGSDPSQTPSFWPGNPVGCNPNQDFIVDAGDLSCTILIIQGGGTAACASGTLAPMPFAAFDGVTSKVSLALPDNVPAFPGQQVTLPLRFDPGSASVNAAVFSIDFDEVNLTFDLKDIKFSLPEGVTISVQYDPMDKDGEIDVVIFSLSGSLPAGEVGTLTFTTSGMASNIVASVAGSHYPTASFGDPAGISLPGVMDNGSAYVSDLPYRVFIPLTKK